MSEDVVARALEATGGNRTRAAKVLGVSRGWLLRHLEVSDARQGRPRTTASDAAIARLAQKGLQPTEIWRTLCLAGHSVSRGTVLRRVRELSQAYESGHEDQDHEHGHQDGRGGVY